LRKARPQPVAVLIADCFRQTEQNKQIGHLRGTDTTPRHGTIHVTGELWKPYIFLCEASPRRRALRRCRVRCGAGRQCEKG
jgi:hypothetical protein